MIYGLPDDYWSRFSSRIGGVSRDSVMELAIRTADPDGMAILVVGDSDKVLRDLEKLGPVTLRGVP